MQAQMNSGVAQQPPQRARVLPPSKTTRLAYIDWMRGLACVLMFQTHCYDSWLSPAARKSSSLIIWSQLGGTLPAPLFIFLAGVSFALVALERSAARGCPEHPRVVDDAHGRSLLGDGRRSDGHCAKAHSRWWRLGGCRRGVRHSAALDDAPAKVSAVAARVLYKRRAYLRPTAAVAVSAVSVVGVCVCGPGYRVLLVLGFRQTKTGAGFRRVRRRGDSRWRSVDGL